MLEKKAIGSRLKHFRKTVKLTQLEMQNHSSVSQSNITRIEQGQLYPNFEYLAYLHKQYNLNLHWLLTGKGELFLKENESTMFLQFTNDPELNELIEYVSNIPSFRKVIMAQFISAKIFMQSEIKEYELKKETIKETKKEAV